MENKSTISVFLFDSSILNTFKVKNIKIPKSIRKLKKYRKTLNKEKGVEKIQIISREDSIKELNEKNINLISKFPKLKPGSLKEDTLVDDETKIVEK